MQASGPRSRVSSSKQPATAGLARLAIAGIVIVLALWLAVAIFVAGIRWAIDPEKQVPVGGPQTHVTEDYGAPPWDERVPGGEAA
jgi:hypothetical protein